MTRASSEFDEFLKETIHRLWDTPGVSKKTVLAVLLATPDAWQVAWDEASRDGITKPVMASVLSVAGLTAALRLLASGPLGLALTGLSVGALVALYRDAPEDVARRTQHARTLVERYRTEFDELRTERDRRGLRASAWARMCDSLGGQFLLELDAGESLDPASVGGLAEHVGLVSMPPPRPRAD